MKENRSLWLVILLLLLVFCCCCTLTVLFAAVRLPGWGGFGPLGNFEETADFSQSLRLDGPLGLAVNLSAGDITVRTGKAGQVVVSGTKHVWGIGPTDARGRMNAFQVRIAQAGNQVTVTGTEPGSAGSHAPRVDLVITVPRQATLQLVTGVGNIQVEGTQGDVTIRADVGRVVLTDVAPAGRLEVQSGVATIELNGPLTPKATYQLTSDVGAIGLKLPGDSRFSIEARSDIGNVSVGFGVNRRDSQQGIAGREVSGVVGSPDGSTPTTLLTIHTRVAISPWTRGSWGHRPG